MPVRQHSAGFTLLELMVVIVVLGIMVSLAVPGFSYLAANTKMKSASSNLHLALLKARSEAVKRSANVTITPTSPIDWAQGWTITTGGNTLLAQEAMGGVSIEPREPLDTAISRASLVYQSTGRTQGAPRLAFNVGQKTANTTQKSDVDVQRCIKLATNGAPYVSDQRCECLKVPKPAGCQ